MYRVDLYARVRRACRVEGMSTREASRVFGLDRKTVRKMLKCFWEYWSAKSGKALLPCQKSNSIVGPPHNWSQATVDRSR